MQSIWNQFSWVLCWERKVLWPDDLMNTISLLFMSTHRSGFLISVPNVGRHACFRANQTPVLTRIQIRVYSPMHSFLSRFTFPKSFTSYSRALLCRGAEAYYTACSVTTTLGGTHLFVSRIFQTLRQRCTMDSHTIFYFLVLFLGGILKEYAKCSPFPDLLISEVNADTPKIPETTEYIELWNTGNCPVSLDGYLISLFSGDQQSSPPYDNVDLSNHCIPGNGFFLIGPETLASLPNVVVNKKDFIQNGNGEAEAIALYKGKFGVGKSLFFSSLF